MVLTNGVPQARGTDPAVCNGPVDFIVTGAATVKIDGQPAARMTDKAMHGGIVAAGSGDVMIGGPTAGVTLGNVDAGNKACQAAAAGRASGSTKQSYYNCGVETTRQIINQATGKGLTEDGLLQQAVANGQAGDGSHANDDDDIDDNDGSSPKGVPNPAKAGGTTPDQREAMLNDNGVPAEQVPGTMGNLAQGVGEGKGVEADIWAGSIWPPSYGVQPGKGAHAVLVTGVEYDENGNMKNVIINDTGAGDCGKAYPADVFQKALMGDNHVVTKGPVW